MPPFDPKSVLQAGVVQDLPPSTAPANAKDTQPSPVKEEHTAVVPPENLVPATNGHLPVALPGPEPLPKEQPPSAIVVKTEESASNQIAAPVQPTTIVPSTATPSSHTSEAIVDPRLSPQLHRPSSRAQDISPQTQQGYKAHVRTMSNVTTSQQPHTPQATPQASTPLANPHLSPQQSARMYRHQRAESQNGSVHVPSPLLNHHQPTSQLMSRPPTVTGTTPQHVSDGPSNHGVMEMKPDPAIAQAQYMAQQRAIQQQQALHNQQSTSMLAGGRMGASPFAGGSDAGSDHNRLQQGSIPPQQPSSHVPQNPPILPGPSPDDAWSGTLLWTIPENPNSTKEMAIWVDAKHQTGNSR